MKKIHITLKKTIIVSVIVFLITTLFSFYFFIKYMDNNDILLKDDLTCNFRERIHVSDFILNMEGKILNNYYIDTSDVGMKTVSISYRNKYGFKVRKKFKVEVLDVTNPIIYVPNPLIIDSDNNIDIWDKIFCADDYDDNVECNIIGSYDLNKIGNYNLKITANDFSGNKVEKDFVLKVVEKDNNITKKNDVFTSFNAVYNKFKSSNTMIGLDISKWQEEIDFKKLKSSGVEFIMIKIGGQNKIKGNFIEDPKFEDNIKGALANNIRVGVYFYSYATSVIEARKQARWVIKKVKDYDLSLPIAFDWENWTNYKKFHLSFNSLNKIAKSFINEVKSNDYDAILYSSKYYLENIWYEDDYDKWLAYYTENNDYKKDYLLWQMCNNGKINGIKGYVDIDIMYTNS